MVGLQLTESLVIETEDPPKIEYYGEYLNDSWKNWIFDMTSSSSYNRSQVICSNWNCHYTI